MLIEYIILLLSKSLAYAYKLNILHNCLAYFILNIF